MHHTHYYVEYNTVEDLVAHNGNWAVHQAIAGNQPEDQAKKLEAMFLVAIEHCADKAASEYLGWLLRALEDVELIPLIKIERGCKKIPNDDESAKQWYRAQAARASRTMKLYDKLPVSADSPVLLETKKMMLTEIAHWCGKTKVEGEANAAFDLILNTPTRFEEEKKMLQDIVRKATDHSFPINRLARCLIRIAPKADYFSAPNLIEVAKILSIGWARNQSAERIARHISATYPLMGCSNSASQLLEQIATNVAALDADAQKLKRSMQPESHSVSAPKGLERIYGNIEIVYPTLNQVDVSIDSAYHQIPTWTFDENEGHEKFESAKKHILRWKKEHPNYSVRLNLTIKNEYSPEPKFTREQLFR